MNAFSSRIALPEFETGVALEPQFLDINRPSGYSDTG
jgi:hypothetical protein